MLTIKYLVAWALIWLSQPSSLYVGSKNITQLYTLPYLLGFNDLGFGLVAKYFAGKSFVDSFQAALTSLQFSCSGAISFKRHTLGTDYCNIILCWPQAQRSSCFRIKNPVMSSTYSICIVKTRVYFLTEYIINNTNTNQQRIMKQLSDTCRFVRGNGYKIFTYQVI